MPTTAFGEIRLGPLRLPRGPFHLALGCALVILGSFFGPACFLGWGMGAFAHEFGHAVAGNLLGRPSLPAFIITLSGELWLPLALLVWAGLAGLAWRLREERMWLVIFSLLTLAYPVLAFTRVWLLLVLLAGHGGELLFSAFCFKRTINGGYFQESERPVYSIVAWTLWFRNVGMCWSLMTSDEARANYLEMSFSEEGNDYLRVAEMLSCPLEHVAGFMLLCSAILPLAGLLLAFWARRGSDD